MESLLDMTLRFDTIVIGMGLLLCREPTTPPCAAYGMDVFPTAEQINDCRAQLETFRAETTRYRDCLADESRAALKRFNEAVENWNRAAREFKSR